MDMREFLTGFLRAEDLDPNTVIVATILDVKRVEFPDTGERKSAIHTDMTKPIILNQTRLAALMGAWGVQSNNWIGGKIEISQGKTPYGGKLVPCIVIKPIVSERIAAEPERPKLGTASSGTAPRSLDDERKRRGSIDIRSGSGAWRTEGPPEPVDDDDIPF
jgi:hypothetical protein